MKEIEKQPGQQCYKKTQITVKELKCEKEWLKFLGETTCVRDPGWGDICWGPSSMGSNIPE